MCNGRCVDGCFRCWSRQSQCCGRGRCGAEGSPDAGCYSRQERLMRWVPSMSKRIMTHDSRFQTLVVVECPLDHLLFQDRSCHCSTRLRSVSPRDFHLRCKSVCKGATLISWFECSAGKARQRRRFPPQHASRLQPVSFPIAAQAARCLVFLCSTAVSSDTDTIFSSLSSCIACRMPLLCSSCNRFATLSFA